jgi:para-nitrobenzyl esterase
MKTRALKFAGLATALMFASVVIAQTPAPVRTQEGLVQGTSADGIAVYLGVPFAAPPVGDLRWRAPAPPASWTGVRAAERSASILLRPAKTAST